jgi:quercetin dioxygenase-like cupin family protein
MFRGWFVGNFNPTAFSTDNCEVAHKVYKAGDYEKKHMHKIATEISIVTKGKVLMNGIEYKEGDIIVMEPGEATDFKAITDADNIVVKVPSVKGDKYLVE